MTGYKKPPKSGQFVKGDPRINRTGRPKNINLLRVNNAPVLPPPGPFLRDVGHCQVQHFQQTVVRRENRPCFCHLSELTVEALDNICRVNESSHFLRVLKIGAQVWPVFPPGGGNLRVLLVPVLGESVQGLQCGRLVHGGINRLKIRHQRF